MSTKHMALLLLSLAAAAAPTLAQTSYAGQQMRGIKSLSPQEIEDLQRGAGMGLAKAAELNSYPGPQHALELAAELKLSDTQREQLQSLMTQHKQQASALGKQLIERERALDQLFASRKASAELVDAELARIGSLQGQLRAEHLKTHIRTTALLNPEQIKRYDALRGYGDPQAQPQAQQMQHKHTHSHGAK